MKTTRPRQRRHQRIDQAIAGQREQDCPDQTAASAIRPSKAPASRRQRPLPRQSRRSRAPAARANSQPIGTAVRRPARRKSARSRPPESATDGVSGSRGGFAQARRAPAPIRRSARWLPPSAPRAASLLMTSSCGDRARSTLAGIRTGQSQQAIARQRHFEVANDDPLRFGIDRIGRRLPGQPDRLQRKARPRRVSRANQTAVPA